jgi:hypothetical protein
MSPDYDVIVLIDSVVRTTFFRPSARNGLGSALVVTNADSNFLSQSSLTPSAGD